MASTISITGTDFTGRKKHRHRNLYEMQLNDTIHMIASSK